MNERSKETQAQRAYVSWEAIGILATVIAGSFALHLGYGQWRLDKEINTKEATLNQRISFWQEKEDEATSRFQEAEKTLNFVKAQRDSLRTVVEEAIGNLAQQEANNQKLQETVAQYSLRFRALNKRIDSLLSNLSECEHMRRQLNAILDTSRVLDNSWTEIENGLTISTMQVEDSRRKLESQQKMLDLYELMEKRWHEGKPGGRLP